MWALLELNEKTSILLPVAELMSVTALGKRKNLHLRHQAQRTNGKLRNFKIQSISFLVLAFPQLTYMIILVLILKNTLVKQ